MTTAQKLEVRASEIRQRLNEISGLEGDKLTDEIRSESETAPGPNIETPRRSGALPSSPSPPKTRRSFPSKTWTRKPESG